MALFESAWDGDVEGIIRALESGVCVDVSRPVSHYLYKPANYQTKVLHGKECDMSVSQY